MSSAKTLQVGGSVSVRVYIEVVERAPHSFRRSRIPSLGSTNFSSRGSCRTLWGLYYSSSCPPSTEIFSLACPAGSHHGPVRPGASSVVLSLTCMSPTKTLPRKTRRVWGWTSACPGRDPDHGVSRGCVVQHGRFDNTGSSSRGTPRNRHLRRNSVPVSYTNRPSGLSLEP